MIHLPALRSTQISIILIAAIGTKLKNCLYNVDWNVRFANCVDAGQHADVFYSVLNDCIDKFVPIAAENLAVFIIRLI